MECVIHAQAEAVDACRSCGKPICATCGDDSRGSYVCARCCATPAETEGGPGTSGSPAGLPGAPAPSRPARSPLLAALLSLALPGLGQLYGGDALRALTFFSLGALLVYAAVESPALWLFAGLYWLYPAVDAYQALRARDPRSGGPAPSTATGRGGAASAWGLIALGLIFLAQNLTGAIFPRLRILLPALVILAGLYLLLSYFRTREDSPA
jgi:hypothetical protein